MYYSPCKHPSISLPRDLKHRVLHWLSKAATCQDCLRMTLSVSFFFSAETLWPHLSWSFPTWNSAERCPMHSQPDFWCLGWGSSAGYRLLVWKCLCWVVLLLSYGPAGRNHGHGHMGAIACFSPSHRWGVGEHLSFLRQPRRPSARPHRPQPHLSWGSKQNYLAIERKSVFLFLAPWSPELCVGGVYPGPLSAAQ